MVATVMTSHLPGEEEVTVKRIVLLLLLLVWVLLALLLTACDGDTTLSPRPPIILSVVTATPEFIGPKAVLTASTAVSHVHPSATATGE